jgi:hypothetical protein
VKAETEFKQDKLMEIHGRRGGWDVIETQCQSELYRTVARERDCMEQRERGERAGRLDILWGMSWLELARDAVKRIWMYCCANLNWGRYWAICLKF